MMACLEIQPHYGFSNTGGTILILNFYRVFLDELDALLHLLSRNQFAVCPDATTNRHGCRETQLVEAVINDVLDAGKDW